MTYPLFSLAKCSSQKAVGALESLDRALDRFAERVEKTCDSVVDSVDRTITHLEQQAVHNYLAPGAGAYRKPTNMQQRKKMHALQQQKLNQLRAEAALRRTAAARSNAARQFAMRRAAQQHQLKNMQGQRMPGLEYNTMHAGRTPVNSGLTQPRRVYGANRGVNNNESRTQAARKREEVAQKVAKQVCADIEKSVSLQQAWAALVQDRLGMQQALEAQMIRKRAARRERDAALYEGEEEDVTGSESEYSEDFEAEEEEDDNASETDLEFDDYSDSEEEEEEEEEVDEEAVENWASLVAARLAKQNANAANWAAMVDAKVARNEAAASKWGALAAKLTGRHHYIGDFYPELENEQYLLDNENDVEVERELYFIGGDSGVMTDVESQMVGVLGRETGMETGIETEAERWEYVGTSDAEESDFEEEEKEEKEVVASSRWWW